MEDFRGQLLRHSDLSDDNIFDIVKCISETEGCTFTDPDFKTFFNNGLSFPKFVCVLTKESEIPGISKDPKNIKQKKENNLIAFKYLKNSHSVFSCRIEYNFINDDYPIVFEQIFSNLVYRLLFHKTILKQSKKLFKTIGINLHKENELNNGLYFVRLLHILTDHEVQLIDKFNDSTDFDQILSPMFNKYNIPLIINSESFTFVKRKYVFLQTQIIFHKYDKKIRSILGYRDNNGFKLFMDDDKDDEEGQFAKMIYNEHHKNDEHVYEHERKEELIFLRLLQIFWKDLGIRIYNFREIIEEGLIPKLVMYFLHIDSIENVTDIDSNSFDIQIKNIEATIDFLKKDNLSIGCCFFDFKTEENRSFSIRLLLNFILKSYFLKSTKKEMNNRYDIITEGFSAEKNTYDTRKIYLKSVKLPFFIVYGRTNCTLKDFGRSDDDYDYQVLDEFCDKHKIPLIRRDSDNCASSTSRDDSENYYFYQLQIYFNMIDERKSLHVIEKLKTVIHAFKRMKVPKFSTITDSIKVKQNTLRKKKVKAHFTTEDNNNDDDNAFNDDITKGIDVFPKKMKKHPSTFKQRFKKRMKRGDQNTNKEEEDNDNDNDKDNDNDNDNNNDNDDDDNENQIETVDQNNDDKTLSNKQSSDNKANIDCDVLKNELNRSAIEDIGHAVYEFHKKFFNVITHFKKIEIAHTQFVEKEYFSIIKILGGENDIGLLYNKNIDILNEQIEKDQQIIQDIFSPYFNKIKMRDTPKEESFEDAKNKGTSYIMKETESVREIKVTLQMKDDLKTIIEQDF